MSIDRLRAAVLPTAFAVALLLLWQALVVVFHYPKVVLPSPADIFQALVANFGVICQQAVPTTRDTLAGFLLVPKIAWTPLFIVWAGIGSPARLTIATFIAFFPIFISMMAGLEATDRSLVRLSTSLTASTWRTFWLVRLPASMPYLFSGLKIGVTLSVIGVIVAEFISSSEGLGFLILRSSALLQTDLILAAIVVLCLLGVGFYGLVHAGERAIQKWQGE